MKNRRLLVLIAAAFWVMPLFADNHGSDDAGRNNSKEAVTKILKGHIVVLPSSPTIQKTQYAIQLDGSGSRKIELDEGTFKDSLKLFAGKDVPVEITGYETRTNLEEERDIFKLTDLKIAEDDKPSKKQEDPAIVRNNVDRKKWWHLSDFTKAGRAIVGAQEGEIKKVTALVKRMHFEIVDVVGYPNATGVLIKLPKDVTVAELRKIAKDDSVEYVEPDAGASALGKDSVESR